MKKEKIYLIEYWQYHYRKKFKLFTDKNEAIEWLNKSGWWNDFYDNKCMIYIYENGKEIDYTIEREWWKGSY